MQIHIRDRRRKEMFKMDDEYLNGYARLCGPYASLVYVSLCRHANRDEQSWPSIELIRTEHGLGSNNTVLKAIKQLEKWGIIEVIREKDSVTKRQKPNVYVLADKTRWKPKPGASCAYGAECISEVDPSASGEKSRVHDVHCKDGHRVEGNTMKESELASLSKKEQIDRYGFVTT